MPGHHHAAGHDEVWVPVDRRTRVALAVVLVAAAVATVAGLVLLWPSGPAPDTDAAAGNAVPGVTYPKADVIGVEPFACSIRGGGSGVDVGSLDPEAPDGGPSGTCAHLEVEVASGAGTGDTATIDVSDVVHETGIDEGDVVQLVRVPGEQGEASYAFFDLDRGLPLALLAAAFALVVVAVARMRGLLALVGLVVAGVVLVQFILPALLRGEEAWAVGLVGSSAILFVVLYLAHGPSVRTSTALLGTLVGVSLTAAIGAGAVELAGLTGLSEESGSLSFLAGEVNLQGLLTCGIIIAGLGVLNDVTITQASAVWELRGADPTLSRRALYVSAMRIGRDHIASTVYTIVFAYAGSALVVLLLIEIYQRGLLDVIVTEPLAEEVVRTVASGIGLVLAVPVTTAIAVAAASGEQP